MDAELRHHKLSVPQNVCHELLAQRPGLSNAEPARGAFVTRQAMRQLLGGVRGSGLVVGEGRGRRERLALSDAGVRRLAAASHSVAAVEESMLAGFSAPWRALLHPDLTACADALAHAGRPLSSP